MLRTVNRVLLALAGLLLAAAGLMALAAGLDLPHSGGSGAPFGWSGPEDVPLTDTGRTRWRAEPWWWPALFTALGAALALALWWLFAQVRRRGPGEVLVDSGDGAGVLLRASSLEGAMTTAAESLPGVARAHVALRGHRSQPRVRVELLLEPHAEPGPTLERLRTEVLEEARTSAGLAALPAQVRLGVARHRPARPS